MRDEYSVCSATVYSNLQQERLEPGVVDAWHRAMEFIRTTISVLAY